MVRKIAGNGDIAVVDRLAARGLEAGEQMRGDDRVRLRERIIDHGSGPALLARAINGNFITVPGLDRRQESFVSQLADSHIARSAFGPSCRAALGNFRLLPRTVLLELV